MDDKMVQIIITTLLLLFASFSVAAVKRVEICAKACLSKVCREMVDEVEFALESSREFLLPPCDKKKKVAQENYFRLEISDEDKESGVAIVMSQGQQKCLNQIFPNKKLDRFALTKLVKKSLLECPKVKHVAADSDAKIPQKIPVVEQKSPQEISAVKEEIKPKPEPEWDRILVSEPQIEKTKPQAKVADDPPRGQSQIGHITMSFGGETWNYRFEAKENGDRISPVYARVYPCALFNTTLWATNFLRFSLDSSASMMSFRIRANQPVAGDGNLISAQSVHSRIFMSIFLPLFGVLHVGGDIGYEYLGTFVDPQSLNEKSVVVVPGYQSHAFRVGPRIVIGNESGKGAIDVSAGFYPYFNYFETPEDPAQVKKNFFAFSLEGIIRMVLTKDVFADVTLKMGTIYSQYESDAKRAYIDGEFWGPGMVTSSVASATAGLGYRF